MQTHSQQVFLFHQGTEDTRGDHSSSSRRSRLKEGLSNLIGKGTSKDH